MADHTKKDNEHNQQEWQELDQARERVIHSIAQNMDLYGIALVSADFMVRTARSYRRRY